MIIRPGEVQMDPGKVSAVKSWHTPTMLKEVRAFIGFANFYRRFIKDFSTMACPLHDLTKKDTPWQWNKEQQEATTRNCLRELKWTSQDLLQEESCLRNMTMVSGTPLLIAHNQ